MHPHAKGALLFFLLCLADIPAALGQEKRGTPNGVYPVHREDSELQQKARALVFMWSGRRLLTTSMSSV